MLRTIFLCCITTSIPHTLMTDTAFLAPLHNYGERTVLHIADGLAKQADALDMPDSVRASRYSSGRRRRLGLDPATGKTGRWTPASAGRAAQGTAARSGRPAQLLPRVPERRGSPRDPGWPRLPAAAQTDTNAPCTAAVLSQGVKRTPQPAEQLCHTSHEQHHGACRTATSAWSVLQAADCHQ